MKLIADESVDKPIVEQLRKDGLSVAYVAEDNAGASDDKVLELANSSNALLLTADKDFGELVYRLHRISHGVILIRLSGLTANLKSQIVSAAFKDHSAELLNAFTVISPESIRVRRSTQDAE